MAKKRVDDLLFKHFPFSKQFEAGEPDDFTALDAAKDWLCECGYSYGSMERHRPIGVVEGDAYISK